MQRTALRAAADAERYAARNVRDPNGRSGRLAAFSVRITLSDMKTSALTIRLDRALERQLAALAKRSGRSRSDIARDALRRQLAVMQFEDARRSVMPFAEARGYLTDEDVFRAVS
jgi:predicted transcriptional regulator